MAGNGANLLDTFQKTHPNANHFVFDSSAPPPPIATAPPDSSERPRTAPSSQQQVSNGTRTEPKKARATKRHGPPYKLPPKIWSTSSAASAALAEPSSPFSPPAPPFAASERAASISSGSSSKGFVDLLDAQWAIKPSDFRSRVQAAGARDYGEDVADRNLRENGFDLRSPKGQEVYLRNTGSLPTGIANDHASDQSQRLNKRHSMGTGLRTASLNSNSYGVHLMKSSIEVSEQRWTSNNNNNTTTSMTKRTNRRNSLHSYVSTTSSMLSTQEPLGRRKPQPLDFSSSPSMVQQKLQRLSELDLDVTTKEKLLGQPPQTPSVIEESPRQPDSQSPEAGPRHRRNASEQSTTSWEEVSDNVKRATNRQTMHYVPGSFGSKSPTKKHRRSSLHSVQSHGHQDRVRPSHKLIAYHEIATSSPTKTSTEIKSLSTTAQREDLDDQGRRARARSIASVSSKDVRPHEIEEIVPERNSSLRNYSLSSETATYSSIGSSPFRPQSRHTPTTSIDLTPTVPFFNFSNPAHNNNSNTPLPSVGGTPRKGQRHSQSLIPSSPTEPSPAKSLDRREPAAPIFTIDDEYASSDDSFDHTWRPRGENEKDLLFVESGYGFNGSQLPGLFDGAVSSRPSSAHMRRLSAFYDPASDASTDPDGDNDDGPDTAVATSLFSGSRRRPSEPPRLRNSAIGSGVISAVGSEAVLDESSDDDDDDICFDIPRSRAAVVATARHHKPPRAAPSSSPPRYEAAAAAAAAGPPRPRELHELPIADLAAIMRQRKMAKAKMRESGVAAAAARQQQQQQQASSTTSATAADTASAEVVEDEGSNAAAVAATAPRRSDERLSGLRD